MSRPSEDMLLLDAEEDLQKKVNAAMAFYSFINKGDICVLRPDDVYRLSEEGEGGNLPIRHRMNRFLLKEHIG